ncbi:MAG: hypothetical protein R3F43_02845 [bacterium]
MDGVAAVDLRPQRLSSTAPDAIVVSPHLHPHGLRHGPDRLGTWDGDKLICRCHDSHFDAGAMC